MERGVGVGDGARGLHDAAAASSRPTRSGPPAPRRASRCRPDRTTIRADGKDLVFITGDIQDANGVIVPNAETSVSFAVTGPGRLVGVDNGNPIDTSSYKGTSRKAFSGKVLAIVQSNGSPGKSW